MSVSFVIESWAACAPGLDTAARWSDWARAPWLPEGEPAAALAAVPPLLRRRFGPLGRQAAAAAFSLAEHAAPPDAEDVPAIFASRYGETTRCLELLRAQTRGEALSPTAFALSVHNAIGALVAIAREDRRPASALAAGRLTAAAGAIEAAGLLDDGASAVNLVVYDAPLPPDYTAFEDEPTAHFAWAWRLRRARDGEPGLRLAWGGAPSSAPAPAALSVLPAGLQPLWFGLSGADELVQEAGGQRCRWIRD